MNAKEKHQLFDKLKFDAHCLDVECGNTDFGEALPSSESIARLTELARKANASAQAFENAMRADQKQDKQAVPF